MDAQLKSTIMSGRLNAIASTQVKKLINLQTKGPEMSFFRPPSSS